MSKRMSHRAQAPEKLMIDVTPNREALDVAIANNGACSPTDCWHYVEINRVMEEMAPGERHHIRVDAGHVKLNYRGYRYIADVPLSVKRSLMRFDQKLYDEVTCRKYKLRFRRTSKIVKSSAERKAAINQARKDRIAAGADEPRRYKGKPTLRTRIEGFSGIV